MAICKQIAKRPHLADDLYQEFFLSLCEIKDDRLSNASDGGYLEVFCYGIISNIWGKRHRVKSYKTGSTSPLYELHNNAKRILRDDGEWMDVSKRSRESAIREDHLSDNREYDFNRDINEAMLHHIIEKYKESPKIDDRFRSRVFYYSRFKYKSVREFADASGIPHRTCARAFKSFKQTIKEELCRY